jgi:hypothetical protein
MKLDQVSYGALVISFLISGVSSGICDKTCSFVNDRPKNCDRSTEDCPPCVKINSRVVTCQDYLLNETCRIGYIDCGT